MEIDTKTGSFPGAKRFYRKLQIHLVEFFSTPFERLASLISFLMMTMVPYTLFQKYYYIVEPTIAEDVNKWTILAGFFIVIPEYIIQNAFFFTLYLIKNPWIEKFKGNRESWPWENNPTWWNTRFRKLLLLSCFNVCIA